jgi:DNA-directed RNA polymerase alpha subunit
VRTLFLLVVFLINRMITRAEYLKAYKLVNDYKNQIKEHYLEVEKEFEEIDELVGITKETKFDDIFNKGLSVRTFNCLKVRYSFGFDTEIKFLENVSIREMKKTRNFGKKGLQEIKDICFYADIKLLK